MAGGLCRMLVMVLVMVCVFIEVGEGAMSEPRKKSRRQKKQEAVEPTQPGLGTDINQMTGTWYLLNTASKCSHLMQHGTKAEATVMTLTVTSSSTGQQLFVSTKTRHNHQCWEIHQVYDFTPASGRFTIKGSSPKTITKVSIVDTDYTSYAIFVYEKLRRTTMKLYTRSIEKLHEPVLLRFEELAAERKMGLEFMFPFPTYSHCDTVDKDHIINCIPTC